MHGSGTQRIFPFPPASSFGVLVHLRIKFQNCTSLRADMRLIVKVSIVNIHWKGTG